MPTPGSEEPHHALTLAGALGDAAVVLDAAGRVVAWNEAAAEHSGIAPSAAGRPVAEVLAAPRVAAATRLALTGGGTVLAWPGWQPIGDDDVARQQARIVEHLAPGIAHDLINQVGGIQGFLQVLEAGDPRDRELLEATAARAMDTVRSFQELVRARRSEPAAFPPAGLVAEALALAAYPLAELTVTVDVPDQLPDVMGVRGDLRQALLAVLVSALDALGWPAAHGSVRVSARPSDGQVEIAIEDDGPSVAAAGDGLFETSTEAVGGREPIDLAVARHLARLDGGELRYEPRPGASRFVLAIPAARSGGEASAADPGAARGAPAVARDVVLVCDDEDAVRSLVQRVLQRAGLRVAGAATAEAGLEVIATGGVTLVLADHHLGPATGLELYERAVAIDPALRGRCILMSGDAGDAALVAFARAHDLHVVEKPFTDLGGLATLVREVAAQRG